MRTSSVWSRFVSLSGTAGLLLTLAAGCERASPVKPVEERSTPAAGGQPAAGTAAVDAGGAAAADAEHAHAHTAPHGGSLVCVGEHLAHLEWVLNPDAGTLDLYVLDGGASAGVRVAAPQVELAVQPTRDGQPAGERFTVQLAGRASALTGEKEGDTSHFSVTAAALRGVREFSGEVAGLTIKGVRFEGLTFDVTAAEAPLPAAGE